MQAYGEKFAKVYNRKWGDFAKRIAPYILNFYQTSPVSKANDIILDLCCGTGQLAVQFLEHGYKVIGIDLSIPMLGYARENAKKFIKEGRAKFLQGDASNFKLDEQFGLIVSTYDSLNHLEDEFALRRCFQCAFAVLVEGGYFIFDLNTRLGLKHWNSIAINDGDEEIIIITRGIYDGKGDKAWTKISGFIRIDSDLYERFEETAFNTVFEMDKVKQALLDIGWEKVYFARIQDLITPLDYPENENRVFIVAQK